MPKWNEMKRIVLFHAALYCFAISSKAQHTLFTTGDSSLNIYKGGRVKITSLISQKRTLPIGTAFLLLPKDVTYTPI